MTIDEMIAVLTAAKTGKVIQARHRSGGDFILATNPCWDFSTYDYRVKPEPREFWINLYDGYTGNVHRSKHEADAVAGECKREQILVREVLE